MLTDLFKGQRLQTVITMASLMIAAFLIGHSWANRAVAQAENRAGNQAIPQATPLGTGFTYQGRLANSGVAGTGPYDLQFKLYDNVTGGSLVGSPSTVTFISHTVTNGLFTVMLDFGATAFDGEARRLEIGARPGGSGNAFTVLTPRQAITPAPYALYAANAGVPTLRTYYFVRQPSGGQSGA